MSDYKAGAIFVIFGGLFCKKIFFGFGRKGRFADPQAAGDPALVHNHLTPARLLC